MAGRGLAEASVCVCVRAHVHMYMHAANKDRKHPYRSSSTFTTSKQPCIAVRERKWMVIHACMDPPTYKGKSYRLGLCPSGLKYGV